jgi:hypothetical protein
MKSREMIVNFAELALKVDKRKTANK